MSIILPATLTANVEIDYPTGETISYIVLYFGNREIARYKWSDLQNDIPNEHDVQVFVAERLREIFNVS